MKLSTKVLGLTLAAAVGVASSTFADDSAKGSGRKSLESRIAELEAKLKDAGAGGVKGSGIKISGYVDTSYTLNLADRDQSGPVAGSAAANTGRVFDDEFNAFSLNAFKLVIEKDKDSSKFPAGFRVDTIIGDDAGTLGASKAGTGTENELFLEQAYVNLGIPLGNGIDVKLGKMVTLIGYEVIESPANWNYSRSDAFRVAPFTQLGATFGYKWNDYVTSTVGVINGFDALATANAGSPGGAVNFNNNLSFVGRLDLVAPKNSLGNITGFASALVGNDDLAATTSNDGDMYIFNAGLGWDKPFGVDPLGLGAEYTYRLDRQTIAAGGHRSIDVDAMSVYTKWTWADWTTSAFRFGYSIYGNGHTVASTVTLSPLAVPTTTGFRPASEEVFSATLTQAFNVWKDTLVRLEWRHDWTDGTATGFGTASTVGRDDIRQEQDTLAVNVVYSF